MDEPPPQFIQHSVEEAARHPSYLLVSTVPWPSAKGAFFTSIEWHTDGGNSGSGGVSRVRTLVECEPIDAAQARLKAETLARRYRVPVVLTVHRQ